MEIPADMRVNGEDFVHITVRQGNEELHLALLEHYEQVLGLDRVILRDEQKLLSKTAIANALRSEEVQKVDTILVIGPGGAISDIRHSDFHNEGRD